MIETNKELAAAVSAAIKESGYKKSYIADKLGIANQNLNRMIEKNNFSLDDANKILNIIGLQVRAEISKKD